MSRIFEALQRSGAVQPVGADGPAMLGQLVQALRPSGASVSPGLAGHEDERVLSGLQPVTAPDTAPYGPKLLLSDAQPDLVAWSAEHTLAAEKFRLLATRLTQLRQRKTVKSLLIS